MHPDWIEQARNIAFIGPTGVGKSYLACAFGQMACRQQYTVLYCVPPASMRDYLVLSN
jgi:DNA replication protein DnaC